MSLFSWAFVGIPDTNLFPAPSVDVSFLADIVRMG